MLVTLTFTEESREAQGRALGQGGDEDGARAPGMLLLLAYSSVARSPSQATWLHLMVCAFSDV